MQFVKYLLVALIFLPSVAVSQEIAPPQDASKYVVYVFTHADWQNRPDEARLMANLEMEPMKTFMAGCRFNHYTERELVYATGRYWNVPEDKFPALIIADPKGAYFYATYKNNVPATAQDIFDNAKRCYSESKTLQATKKITDPNVHQPQSAQPAQPEPHPAPREPWMPNAPWNAHDNVPQDIEGLFGPTTPILTTIAWTGWIVTGLFIVGIVLLFLCIAAPLGIAALYLFMKLIKG